LRAELMRNIVYLRGALASEGLEPLGDPSAIVSVKVDDEAFARVISQRLNGMGAIVNLVEYPAVSRGSALFRLQVMSKHTLGNIDRLVSALKLALSEKPAKIFGLDGFEFAQPLRLSAIGA